MKISVFTPTHNPIYLNECYDSLKAQTHQDWEWIIILNNGAEWQPSEPDERVMLHTAPEGVTSVGALKKAACGLCTGDYLLELDHDDMLTPDCMTEILEAFDKHPYASLVYSDTVRFRDDGQLPVVFDKAYGWAPPQTHSFSDGRIGLCQPSFEPSPQMLGRIWYAPDHVRCWERDAYFTAGGHDPNQPVCDDYGLVIRSYLHAPIYHITKPLYWYRVTANSTSAPGAPMHETIQVMQAQIGDFYRVSIAETWAKRAGLALVDLCSGGNPPDGYTGIDKHPSHPCEVRADLADHKWPLGTGEVGVIRAQDALEHLPNKLRTMQLIHKALAHGGYFFSETPSTDGRGAYQDPTHVSYWNSNSFWYYTAQAQMRYVQDAPHFQMWQLENIYYSEWHKLHEITHVKAHLSCIKPDGPRLAGPYDFTP